MTSYTTKTREFGKITFSAPSATDTADSYVFIETSDGYPSKQPRQICRGGKFKGDTISATTHCLKEKSQQWLRQRREWMRKEYAL